MNNQSASSPSFRHRIAPLYGDGEILYNIPRSKLWRSFFDRKTSTTMIILREFLRIKLAMCSFAGSVLFRYRYGGRTIGIMLTIFTFLMIAGWNSNYLYLIAKPLFPFTAPLFPLFVEVSFWQDFFLEDIRSIPMVVYSGIYLCAALFHTGCVYFGYGDQLEPTKRGTSLLHHFFLKYHGVSEYYVQAVIEPLILGAIAAFLWFVIEDRTFALFLAFSGLTLFLQEVIDRAAQMRHRTG